jgi:pterin-4a-carbinolamine dehydratase
MWQEIDNKLYKRFEFKDFSTAFGFMTPKVGSLPSQV